MKQILFAALCLCAATAPAFSQVDLDSPAAMTRLAQAAFPEYLRFLAMPSDAVVPADIQKNAAFVEAAFRSRGFEARQLDNTGKPMVFAEMKSPTAGARTVLFYMHLDSQPVVASEWAQKDPWTPVVKRRNAAGQWEEVAQSLLFAPQLDPELRVFGRSSSDDKGPIMMFLSAFDGLNAAGIKPAMNVKVLIDSEEEKGSPSIAGVIRRNLPLLRTDAIVIHDGPRHGSNRPTLIFGNRGAARVTLTVHGPYAPLHSGHYGNYVPNPAIRLAQLLAGMKDEQGRVLVKGYYDRVQLSAEDRKALQDVGDDEAALLTRVGIAKPEAVGGNYQEALQFPSLNVRGMAAASVGDKASNVVPHQAIAEFDLRTTPESPPDYLFGLLKAHVESRGYHLVDGAPTAQDRKTWDKLATLSMGGAGRAVRTPMDSPLGQWAFGVLKRTGGTQEPVRIRMMGGSVPTDSMVEALQVPFVILPLVNGDNNQHAYDENMRIGHYLDGIRTVIGLVRSPL
jgi:acetylornithine deacetylase/succinyl-diaminopimelate desuccinylase-like protein